jgi:hypothetical protein
MKNFRKHIVTICLILLAASPIVAPIMLLIQQQFVIHEMKEKMEHSVLHTIRIQEDKVEWTREKNECIINGKMFDVHSIIRESGFLLLNGLYDDEETVIIRNLVSTATDNQQENNRAKVIFIFTHLQAVENPDSSMQFDLPTVEQDFNIDLQANIMSAHTFQHYPPPNC